MIPTQKLYDVSVPKFSNVTMLELMQVTASWCRERGIPLVIKIHPHLQGEEVEEQRRIITGLAAEDGAQVVESKASINFLARNARHELYDLALALSDIFKSLTPKNIHNDMHRFTVTVNGGTIADNMFSGTPVMSVAKSMFMRTDALIYDPDVRRGLTRIFNESSPWPEWRKERQRQIMCWYERMSMKVRGVGGCRWMPWPKPARTRHALVWFTDRLH